MTLDIASAANLGSAIGAVLPVFAPLIVLLAAVLALFQHTRVVTAPLVFLAIAADVGLGVTSTGINAALGTSQQPLFAWSPLGLYGATLALEPQPGSRSPFGAVSWPCAGEPAPD